MTSPPRQRALKVVLTNFGTRGDVQPFLALAIELRRHGHQPRLAMPPAAEKDVRRLGLDFVPVGPDLAAEQHEITRWMTSAGGDIEAAGDVAAVLSPLGRALPRMFEELRAATHGADMLIAGRMQPAARMLHDLTQVPFVSVHVEHSGGSAGGSGGSPAFRQAVGAMINPARAQLGLAPLTNPLVDGNSPQLVLFAVSRHVRRPALDWPPHYHLTGYFFLDDAELTWTPPPKLTGFLEAGPAPVAFTFGSLAVAGDPQARTALLREACARAHLRGLLMGVDHDEDDPAWCTVGELPYSWLLPKVAAVLHHGGAGTTAAALRAGVPQMIVPHAYDQFVWADLIHQLGCSPPALQREQLSADGLVRAMEISLSPEVRRRAASLGEQVRAEQGVARARELIEDLAARLNGADTPDGDLGPRRSPARRAAPPRRPARADDE